MEFINSILATLAISLVSFISILVLLKKINSQSLIITALVSFAAGSLIGDVFFHLLPEEIEHSGGYDLGLGFGITIGILIMLLVEAYLHCSHDSDEEFENHKKGNHRLAILNIIGDAIHNFLDGIAIAVSFLVSPAAGVASTIGIIMHEIPQELADASVLLYSGWKRSKILLFNFLTALTAVLGAISVFVLSSFIENIEIFLGPIAIGQFLYIALADLVPVIHKKNGWKKYFIEILMFVAGIGVMYLLTLVEVGH